MAVDTALIGKNIKYYRSMRGLSQEELANQVYVSSIHISYLENGAKTPSLELLVLIANALDVSADDLLAENLTHTSSSVGRDLHILLQSCSNDEREMLTRIMQFMKELFTEFGI